MYIVGHVLEGGAGIASLRSFESIFSVVDGEAVGWIVELLFLSCSNLFLIQSLSKCLLRTSLVLELDCC